MVAREHPSSKWEDNANNSLGQEMHQCFSHAESGYPSEDGQCNGNRLCEQNGGNPLRTALQSSSADVEEVLREKHLHSRRTPTWQREYKSRLVLLACTRLQQLKTPLMFHHLQERVGPFSIDLFASQTNAQLPTYCSWRPDPSAVVIDALSISWKNHYPYLFPPFALLNRCLAKIRKEEVEALIIAPVWHVVPTTTTESEGSTDLTPKHRGHNPRTSRRTTPPTISCMACIREGLSSRGFSDRVVSIMQKSWRGATESAYSSVWRRSCWCVEWEVDPVSAPINLVLEFLMDLFEEGKQYRTINTACSAISMTHDNVDRFKVGQHPLTVRFLRGIFNSRPPAPHYSETWDVDKVLKYIRNLPENSQLSLQSMTHKLAILM